MSFCLIFSQIKEVRYGDVTTDKGEKGKSIVGPLICKWDKKMAVTSCEALARDGVRESGNYMIDPGYNYFTFEILY